MKARIATAALLAVTLAGCAAFQQPSHCIDRGDGICWYVNPVQIPVKQYDWEVDTADNASARCGYDTPWDGASCMMGRIRETGTCHIVSALTHEQARTTKAATPIAPLGRVQSVLAHELDHCGLGPDGIAWLHSDTPIRKLLP